MTAAIRKQVQEESKRPRRARVRDVAGYLGISRSKVRELIDGGKLRAVRYDDMGPYLVEWDSVIGYEAAQAAGKTKKGTGT